MARGVQVYTQATQPTGSQVQVGDIWVKPGAPDLIYICSDAQPGIVFVLCGTAGTGDVNAILAGDGITVDTPTGNVTVSVTPVNAAIAAWDDTTEYLAGDLVVDRGGTWQAAAPNDDSQPISGNTDWTLVGGTPFVDVTLTPPELVSLPFYDPTSTLVNVVIPAPGAGKLIQLRELVIFRSTGTGWDTDLEVLQFMTPDGDTFVDQQYLGSLDALPQTVDMTSNVTDGANVPIWHGLLAPRESVVGAVPFPGFVDSSLQIGALENKGVVMMTTTDLSSGLTVFGTCSLFVRLYYTIYPTTPPDGFATFFIITAVNTAAKRLFVTGDASALDGAISITGSTGNDGDYTVSTSVLFAAADDAIVTATGITKTFVVAGDHAAEYPVGIKITVTDSDDNDGTYTVVSATFTSSTAIVVAETVVDSLADGTIAHVESTRIIVTEVVADATADGWVTS